MSVIQVTEVFQGPALGPGVTVKSVALVVTDATDAAQSITLTGTETPTPWSVSVTVAPGKGSVSSTQTDSTGAQGQPISQSYDTGSTGTAALSLSGTTISITTP